MNILGVDFGTKRIGLAWTQMEIGVVLPYGQIRGKDRTEMLLNLAKLINEEKIDKVVFGLPLTLEGQESPNSRRVRAFIDDLKKNINVPVDFYDERLSSFAADQMEGGATRDEKAAMIILQDYLEANK
ncbi:MAG TPA: Holliday junction resolvase RuvX [Candidatus Magasanikbacteria bacterium]|nr:Holliday junction resolvase RuvX [Candidatus Magasanikbacteria bacterium]